MGYIARSIHFNSTFVYSKKVLMSQSISKQPTPIFFRMSTGFLLCSIFCQVYFFVIINDVFNKEFTAIGVIEGIVEWIYLVGPSFFFSVTFYGMSLLTALVSYFRKEQERYIKWIFGVALFDLIVFMSITLFHYG